MRWLPRAGAGSRPERRRPKQETWSRQGTLLYEDTGISRERLFSGVSDGNDRFVGDVGRVRIRFCDAGAG
jgi:hypothetical protein